MQHNRPSSNSDWELPVDDLSTHIFNVSSRMDQLYSGVPSTPDAGSNGDHAITPPRQSRPPGEVQPASSHLVDLGNEGARVAGVPAYNLSRNLRSPASFTDTKVRRTFSELEEGRLTSKDESGANAIRVSALRRLSLYDPLEDLGLSRRNDATSQLDSDEIRDIEEAPASDRRRSIIAGPRRPSYLKRPNKPSSITRHVEDVKVRRQFILKLAKALLCFGAPSHRIESQLTAASQILDAHAAFVHIPNIIIVTLGDGETRSMETHFVRANGRIALTSLHKVHLIYRDVLHDKLGSAEGAAALDKVLQAPPIYPLIVRCGLAFICASIICALAFGGAVVDMWISGACACILQYLGLNAATKSSMYANVYEISVSIIVSFVARLLSTVPGNLFCYSAISSAGVVLILPGFTILMSALELTSRNILCGSVRLVYAIIYTLFLGFGLTIGSDLYLVINPHARHVYQNGGISKLTMVHGYFTAANGTEAFSPVSGTFGIASNSGTLRIVKGCVRDPSWPWWRQPFPWWTLFFLVPIYSTCSSLSNLQTYRSVQLLVMVLFSCAAYAANKAANVFLPDRGDIVSAAGALVIGALGNVYSRVVRGTAFTSMVTGVLFLVPSGIAQGGGLTQTYHSSAEQYSSGFGLALRMIQVAIGVTIGLFVSQIVVYAMGRRKNAAHFAF